MPLISYQPNVFLKCAKTNSVMAHKNWLEIDQKTDLEIDIF
ncbi:hypothetical protein [Campylobacter fetus]|nr:hypothetical protein [Campylobacter fetus]